MKIKIEFDFDRVLSQDEIDSLLTRVGGNKIINYLKDKYNRLKWFFVKHILRRLIIITFKDKVYTLGFNGIKKEYRTMEKDTRKPSIWDWEIDEIDRLLDGKYTWNIDPLDRAWFIALGTGKLHSGMSHRLLIKTDFKKEWDHHIQYSGETEAEIERVLTYRFIQCGGIKIGEYDGCFQATVNILDGQTKIALQGFFKSILKTRKVSTTSLIIDQVIDFKKLETINCTFGEVSKNELP